MIHHTNIILVTKPSSVNCSLDDGVVVWVTASPRFLIIRLSHRGSTTRMTQTNRINKIHLPQQPLSAFGVIAYASVSLTRLEAIHIFHESRNLGFHFCAQLVADACGPGIRMYVKVRGKKRVRRIVELGLPTGPRISRDRVLHRFRQRNGINVYEPS